MSTLDGLSPELVAASRQAVEAYRHALERMLDPGPLPERDDGQLPPSEALLAATIDALGLRSALTTSDRADLSERSLRRVLRGDSGRPTTKALIRAIASMLVDAAPSEDLISGEVAADSFADAIDTGREDYDRLVDVLPFAGLPRSLELSCVLRAALPHVAIRLAAAIALAGRTSTANLVIFEDQPFGAFVDAFLRTIGHDRRDLARKMNEWSLYAWCRGENVPSDGSITNLVRQMTRLAGSAPGAKTRASDELRRMLRCARALVVARRALVQSIGEDEAARLVRALRAMTELALREIAALPIEEWFLYELAQTEPDAMKERLEARAAWSKKARDILETGVDPRALTTLLAVGVQLDAGAREAARESALQALLAAGPGCLAGVVISRRMVESIDDGQTADDVAAAAIGEWRRRALYWAAHLAFFDHVLEQGEMETGKRMEVLRAFVGVRWPR